jgi:hypothetical protein
MTDDQASSNVLFRIFRILNINKLFRSKNRFYLDLCRSLAKRKAQEEAVNYAMDCKALNCFTYMIPSSEKSINANDTRPSPNQVSKDRSQLSLFLDRW